MDLVTCVKDCPCPVMQSDSDAGMISHFVSSATGREYPFPSYLFSPVATIASGGRKSNPIPPAGIFPPEIENWLSRIELCNSSMKPVKDPDSKLSSQ